MKTTRECVPCFVRQAVEAVEMTAVDAARKEYLLRMILTDIARADWTVIPVTVSQRMHRMIRDETGIDDPYYKVKQQMNQVAVELMPALSRLLARQLDQQEAIVRLAAAGNLLDSGAKSRVEPQDLQQHLQTVWQTPFSGSVQELFAAAAKAKHILYLADNAGEIFFDRLLIEALPKEKITVAVRGTPIINDATLADAEAAGLTTLIRVIDNGSDAPGTLLPECSESFRQIFEQADLIISKGQGNYETLSESRKHIFFILTVKCPAIANDIGIAPGTLVIKNNAVNAPT